MSGMDAKKTESEKLLDNINTNVFFKEFTFGFNNRLKVPEGEIELADNIISLDEMNVIFEVKERNPEESSTDIASWFAKKILKKAVEQIKKTIGVLEGGKQVEVYNNRGLKVQLPAMTSDAIGKVIVYDPKEAISEELRFRKFYDSSSVGLIHLFHIEDYLWVCRFLVTPYEVNDYLIFREEYFLDQKKLADILPEQYILVHYFSGVSTNAFVADFSEILAKMEDDIDFTEMTSYLATFGEKVELTGGSVDYYHILRELAKLHRNELREFKRRFDRLFKLCKERSLTDPYRIAVSTGCGFVFLALPSHMGEHWETALKNITLAHQYEQKLPKCIGVVVYQTAHRFEVFWLYSEGEWQYDEEMEIAIKELPLRKVSVKPFKAYDLGAE